MTDVGGERRAGDVERLPRMWNWPSDCDDGRWLAANWQAAAAANLADVAELADTRNTKRLCWTLPCCCCSKAGGVETRKRTSTWFAEAHTAAAAALVAAAEGEGGDC